MWFRFISNKFWNFDKNWIIMYHAFLTFVVINDNLFFRLSIHRNTNVYFSPPPPRKYIHIKFNHELKYLSIQNTFFFMLKTEAYLFTKKCHLKRLDVSVFTFCHWNTSETKIGQFKETYVRLNFPSFIVLIKLLQLNLMSVFGGKEIFKK